tara:strand:- start:566 stop:1285 length:720 start_codon:yes stop_codon:yes gene_type:complete
MSRILKRPMFKKGGSTGEGIMTGLVDRKNLSTAGMVKTAASKPIDPAMLRSDTKAILDALNQFAPLPKTRIPFGQVGFALTQGATPIEAIGAGYGAFTKADDARRKLLASRKGAAVTAGIQRQLGRGGKGMFAAQTPEAQFAVLFKGYQEARSAPIRNNARNLAAFEVYTKPKKSGYVQIKYTQDKRGEFKPDFRVLQPGNYTYDPMNNQVIEKTKEGQIRRLSPINLEPLEKVDGTES